MNLSLYHAPASPWSVVLIQAEGRFCLSRWTRETDGFEDGPWTPGAATPTDCAISEDGTVFRLVIDHGTVLCHAPDPRPVQADCVFLSSDPNGPQAGTEPRLYGFGKGPLFGTTTHCACHREWGLIRDFSDLLVDA